MYKNWKSVWITGASSGIGYSLAEALAASGATVVGSARRKDKLTELASRHDNIIPIELDVSNISDVKSRYKEINKNFDNGIDLVILNAGISRLFTLEDINKRYADIITTMETNYFGVTNCHSVIIPDMIKRKKGHIAIMSSIAGYRGLPNSIAYSPSKAALINLADILKSELLHHGITVSIINPGFVDTDATKVNNFNMPSLVSIDYATKKIIQGLSKEKYEICFPFLLSFTFKIMRFIPHKLYFYIIKKFIWKESPK